MAAPPPPPIFGGRPPGGPVGAVDFLARTLTNVCKNLPGVLPMQCFSPARPPFPGGQAVLQNGNPPLPVSQDHCEKLLSALASLKNANNAATAVADRLTIRQFRTLAPPQQIAHIDLIWNAISTAHAFTSATSTMFDPAGDGLDGNGPLPSSVCPTAISAGTFKKRLSGKQPFREFGVGFRVDGGDNGAVARIKGQGMTQQRLNIPFMLQRRGLKLEGTVMMDQTHARVWTGNHDIFNESAVCVSRNFFGGTAFPERETVGKYYLWAVDVSALSGFDTEQHQTGLPGSKQWRPGEKAYAFIPANKVLAYVEIDRRGAPATGGWKFDIAKDANWTWIGAPTVKQRTYVEDELAAWRGGSYTIPADFDFATG